MSVEVYGGGGASLKLQSKIVTPSTEQQIVTPDSGMDGLSKVTVNAMPGGTLAAPTISESGVITSKIEKGGYLNTGDNRTLRLSTQAGKLVTPTSLDQSVVPKGYFTTGEVFVRGDRNLNPDNIRNGVSIFDVAGNFTGDGNYKLFSGTVPNNSLSTYLTLPTPGDYIAPNKLKAIVMWSVHATSGQTSLPITLLWIYAAFVSTSEVHFFNDNSNVISTAAQGQKIMPISGAIQAGWETAWSRFDMIPYYYIVVAEV